MINRMKTVFAFLRYNALHIFGGRFVIFLGLALGLFFLVLVLGLVGRGGTPNSERLFNYLIHRFDEERAELGRTMWAAYNALTHWATHTKETWTGDDGKERQTGRTGASEHMVQRQRNDKVRGVITSPTWTYLASVAA